MPIPLPDSGTATSNEPALKIDQLGSGEGLVVTATDGVAIVASHDGGSSAVAVHAKLNGAGQGVRAEGGLVGVVGHGEFAGVTGSSPQAGVFGLSDTGAGVAATSSQGTAIHALASQGVATHARSMQSVAVYAESDVDNAVLAEARASNKAAVWGISDAAQEGIGVVGMAPNKAGVGVVAEGGEAGLHARGLENGVVTEAASGTAVIATAPQHHAVVGTTASPKHVGVIGLAQVDDKTASEGAGVLGVSTFGAGVRGRSDEGIGVDASSSSAQAAVLRSGSKTVAAVEIEATAGAPGLRVKSAGRGGIAVVPQQNLLTLTGDAIATHTPPGTPNGIWVGTGAVALAGEVGVAVHVEPGRVGLQTVDSHISTMGGNVTVVSGDVTVLGGSVSAASDAAEHPAISGYGVGNGGSLDPWVGVLGTAMSQGGLARGVAGIAADPEAPHQWAGFFVGNVRVLGTLYKSDCDFEIDHPQRPTEAYLRHAAMESDDRRTLYDGEVVLDQKGRARVVLPSWFAALNERPRYQLTAIGDPAPNLHVIEGPDAPGAFEIAGGTAGMRVCWQVTARRRDPWAAAHPFEVEVAKDRLTRGTYLHPVEHGAPPEQGESWTDLERARRASTAMSEEAARRRAAGPRVEEAARERDGSARAERLAQPRRVQRPAVPPIAPLPEPPDRG